MLNDNIAKAKRKGLLIVEPKPNQLQIDLDSPRAIRVYGRRYAFFERLGMTRKWKEKITPSFAPGHVHITITMPRAKPIIERVALEALLGSDGMRECLNYARVKRGCKYAISFFEKRK